MILHWSSVSNMQETYLTAKEIHGRTQIAESLVVHRIHETIGHTLCNNTWLYMDVYDHESINFPN